MKEIEEYLLYKTWKGLERKGLHTKQEYIDRCSFELQVINKLGFPGYFLIVNDILEYARSKDIYCGPGRGSVAGSLVAFCLDITQIDPIKLSLVFERFLNPDRVSPPDIDLDFDPESRDQIFEYLTAKYGKDKVAHIGTFGKMKAKGAVRAAARILGRPELGDPIAKKLLGTIHGKPQPISASIEKLPEVQGMFQSKSLEADILKAAQQLENLISSIGVHASGCVISNRPIIELVPLFLGKSDEVTTQWEMKNIEEVGLVKFDILGLKTLTKIKTCIKLIKKRHNILVDLSIIDLEDDKVFAQLRAGNVQGVFQLETSTGMRDLLVQIRPTVIEDLMSLVSIFRPGPLQNPYKDIYLAVRAGQRDPEYLVPELEPILKPTGGWCIWQESALQIAKDLCGYTLAEADLLRKAIGKKKTDEMKKEEKRFKAGWVKKGLDPHKGDVMWDQLLQFSEYAFNKAHAAAYALLAYQTAWLKTYYPHEFMTANLICDRKDKDQIIKYLAECKRLGIKVMPPDINKSSRFFDLDENNNIRFGLAPIKNIGEGVEEILQKREGGQFSGFEDFCSRVDLGIINRLKLESLVRSGTFDSLGLSRLSLLQGIEAIWQYRKEYKSYLSKLETFKKKSEEVWQRTVEIDSGKLTPGGRPLKPLKLPTSPTEPTKPELINLGELPEDELSIDEHELLGYFVSTHPLEKFKDLRSQGLLTIEEIKALKDTARVKIAGVVSAIKPFTNKRKQNMAFLDIEDLTGRIDAVIFPSSYEKYKESLIVGRPIKLLGTVEHTEGEDEESVSKLLVQKVEALSLPETELTEAIDLNIPSAKKLEQLIALIGKRIPGKESYNLNFLMKDGTKIRIGTFRVDGIRGLLKELEIDN